MKVKTILAALTVVGVCNAQDFAAGDEDATAAGSAAEAVAESRPETTAEVATEVTAEVTAEATADGSFVESPDGAMAQEQAAMEEPPQTAIEGMKKLLSTKYADADTAPDKSVVYEEITFDVPSPDVGTEFISQRAMKMSALILQAKVKVAESIYSRMSGSQILDRPDAPLDSKLRAQMDEVEKSLKIAYMNLSKLGVEYKQAKLDKNADLTPSERAAVIGNWLGIAKENNLALQLDQKKKASFEKAAKQYEEAKAKFAELAAAAEEAKPQVLEEMRSNLKSATQMQMHGGIVLEQAEDYSEPDDDGNVSCTMGILFSWSKETEDAATAVMSARHLKLKPGKNDVRGWLDKKAKSGALAQWLGPRRYIDNQGNLWFLGIAAVPTSRIGAEKTRLQREGNLKSRGEVAYALYADATQEAVLEEAYKETQKVPGEHPTAQYVKSFAEKMSQKFENFPVFGLKSLGTYDLTDPASGQKICVCVSGVNASNAADMRKAHEEASKKGIAINRWLQRERGRTDRLRAEIVNSRNNQNAYNQGVGDANKTIRSVKAIKPITQPTRQKPVYKPGKPAANSGKGRLGPVSVFHSSDDDE